mmetsp:Transcript_5070/g.14057  ORF Transcript_5070/g.14057 Transcript_5070/m.14057 type:complete len:226 (+) Transcript_5070:1092-1769(+)
MIAEEAEGRTLCQHPHLLHLVSCLFSSGEQCAQAANWHQAPLSSAHLLQTLPQLCEQRHPQRHSPAHLSWVHVLSVSCGPLCHPPFSPLLRAFGPLSWSAPPRRRPPPLLQRPVPRHCVSCVCARLVFGPPPEFVSDLLVLNLSLPELPAPAAATGHFRASSFQPRAASAPTIHHFFRCSHRPHQLRQPSRDRRWRPASRCLLASALWPSEARYPRPRPEVRASL